MRYAYPVTMTTDEEGRVLARFLDVPEALTDGANRHEALTEAADALAVALAGYVAADKEIPRPSAARGRTLVPLPALAAAKLALYQALRQQGVNKSELARRLGVSETIARRLISLDHDSRIDRVQEALAVLNRRLIVEDAA